MKRCHRCHRTKNLKHFGTSRHTFDGFRSACRSCSRKDARKFYARFPEKSRARYAAAKAAFVAAYGGKCYCCGETEPAFLTLDHIKGGGIKDRLAHSGAQMYFFAKRQGYPKLYRCACMNCNLATARGRACPHQLK